METINATSTMKERCLHREEDIFHTHIRLNAKLENDVSVRYCKKCREITSSDVILSKVRGGGEKLYPVHVYRPWKS